jgi:lipoprotein-releasing system ATP-binding protein
MNKATLTCNQVHKSFIQGNQTSIVLDTIDICFMQGITYAITGHSGSGKSTLIHLLAGLDTPSQGNILYNNTTLSAFSQKEITTYRNQTIGLVFQSPYLIKELTVLENIMLPGMIANYDTTILQETARMLSAHIGIFEKIDCKPGELSGGQQQRVALARALINHPKFLIADELTGNLDFFTGQKIVDLIVQCQKEWGMGIIISSHDDYVANAMNEVYELNNGLLTKKK